MNREYKKKKITHASANLLRADYLAAPLIFQVLFTIYDGVFIYLAVSYTFFLYIYIYIYIFFFFSSLLSRVVPAVSSALSHVLLYDSGSLNLYKEPLQP